MWGDNNNRVRRELMQMRALQEDYENEQRVRLLELNRQRAERLEREEQRDREMRLERIGNVLQRYWRMHEEDDQEGMRGIIERFKTDYGYGEYFDSMLLGRLDEEEVSSYWEQTDDDGNIIEISVRVEEYFGTELWKCRFCGERTNGDDILGEGMLNN